MRLVEIVVAVFWGAFWLYWLVAAFSMKRGHHLWSRELGIRVLIAAIVYALVRVGAFQHQAGTSNWWRGLFGIAILLLGLGFAVWARVHIGSNWGTPMTMRDAPRLVASGPYRLVRHPIYSGILLAGIGTAIAVNWQWLIAVALAGIYFIYSALVEERHMSAKLPELYPAYKRTTKMFVPFVL